MPPCLLAGLTGWLAGVLSKDKRSRRASMCLFRCGAFLCMGSHNLDGPVSRHLPSHVFLLTA